MDTMGTMDTMKMWWGFPISNPSFIVSIVTDAVAASRSPGYGGGDGADGAVHYLAVVRSASPLGRDHGACGAITMDTMGTMDTMTMWWGFPISNPSFIVSIVPIVSIVTDAVAASRSPGYGGGDGADCAVHYLAVVRSASR
jgi:hypothetical protein